MKSGILIIALCSSFVLSAQNGKLKKADNYYAKVAYSEAAELYADLLGSKVDSPSMKAKLANCFYQMGETGSAEKYYSEVVTTQEASSQDVYNYAQSLKENGKYTESDEWMEKFATMQANDSRGQQFSNNKDYAEQIKAQEAYFSLKHLAINTAQSDFGGYPVNNKVFFVSNRKSPISVQHYHTWDNQRFFDVYSANVASDASLENPEYHSKKINKRFHEGPMCFTQDGKTVYFTRNNMQSGKKRRDTKGIQHLRLFKATIDEDGSWVNEIQLSINSREYSVGHPTISTDGKTLYFVSDMPGGLGGADLYKATIADDGSIGKPENLGENYNTEGQEMFPWMSPDGILFFSSDGRLGLGGLDVFAALPNKDGSFKKLVNLGRPVNSIKDDFALTIGSDNETGYLSSNRDNGSGADDIYAIKLLRPLKVNLSVHGVVTDVRSSKILPGATVRLTDPQGNTIASTIADAEGHYVFNLEEETDYALVVTKDEYFDNNGTVSTKGIPNNLEELTKDLTLEKDPGLALYTQVLDAKTNAPLDNVAIIIIDNITGKEFGSSTTGETGDFLKGIADKKLDDRISYNIEVKRDGYFSKTMTFNHKIEQPGKIDVVLTMDEEIKDLSVLINAINFDLGKWNIRKDAAIELDKIVAVMNEYPNMVVELGAHTDCRGSKGFNMRLSDKRAKSSAEYIKKRITNPERISGKGYGESRLLNGCECEGPVKSTCDEEEHSKNRRTEFLVISTGDDKVRVKNQSTNSFE